MESSTSCQLPHAGYAEGTEVAPGPRRLASEAVGAVAHREAGSQHGPIREDPLNVAAGGDFDTSTRFPDAPSQGSRSEPLAALCTDLSSVATAPFVSPRS